MAIKNKKSVTLSFQDRLSFDSLKKTVISVRDGILEYLGAEIGHEPKDKVFKIFRSPATIANAASAMSGIPVTDDHVALDQPPSDSIGNVDSSEIIDLIDDDTGTRIGVKNGVNLNDSKSIDEKHELSLGYTADLVESDGAGYDFEQKNIIPHHLAIVEAGRCGPACRFIDKQKGEKMHKVFLDEEGKLNLQSVVEITKSLPEVLKQVPVENLPEVMEAIKEIMAMAEPEKTPEADPAEPAEEVPATDAEKGAAEKKEEDDKTPMKDSAEFKDTVSAMIKTHTEAIEKAHDFVDEAFVFAGKSTDEIMRAALESEYGKQVFTDAELPVAFKLLKKQATNLTNFGDSKGVADKIAEIGEKEL